MRKATCKYFISGIMTGALLLSPLSVFAEEENLEFASEEELLIGVDWAENEYSDEASSEEYVLEETDLTEGEDDYIEDVINEDPDDTLDDIVDGLFEEDMLDAAEEQDIPIDQKHFPDPVFRDFIKKNCDKDGDGGLSSGEINQVEVLEIDDLENDEEDELIPLSLDGIGYFTNLKTLSCDGLYGLEIDAIDLQNNKELETLSIMDCTVNSLNIKNNAALKDILLNDIGSGFTSLDVSNLSALEEIECYNNDGLKSINASGCTTLEIFYCQNNKLGSLDVGGCNNLKELYCQWNQLPELDVSECPELTDLNCVDNQLTELNVGDNTKLGVLYCAYNQLSDLDVSHNTNLTRFDCNNNQLTALDVKNNTLLEGLWCSSNKISRLEMGDLTQLKELSCSHNNLQSIDVSGFTALQQLWCGANPLQKLDVSNNSNLIYLHCFNSGLEELNISNNALLEELYCHQNQLTSLNITNCSKLKDLYCNSNHYTLDGVEYYGTTEDEEEYDDEEEEDDGGTFDIYSFTGLAVDSGVDIITIDDPSHIHTYENWTTITPATCTTKGVESGTCICGLRTTKAIPAFGHAFGTWKVTVPATEEAEGSQVRTCSRCGKKEARVIPRAAVKITISKAPSLSKPKAAAKGKATITWKKFKQTKKTKAIWKKVKKVEVQYSTDPTFKTKISKLTGKSKTKLSVKGLQKNTTYYVRTRYTDGAGGYSKWSGTKKFKTNKK